MTYDIAGRPKKYRNNNVEWNGSQMTKYGRNTYEYDGNNYRVFKQTPTEKTYYSYDGSGNLRFERRGRTEINYIYDEDGIRGMKVTVPTDDPSTYYASSEFYYVKDSLGNIRVILDKSGNIMVGYNYDAWGNFIAEKVRAASIGSVTVDLVSLNAFTYRGYYYDKESGLYYLINRYYDPVTGRFISPDDVSYLDFESFFGTNRYAYCLDDPVNESDPDGTMPNWMKWVIGGVVIVGLIVATFFTGGASAGVAGFIVAGALKGAVIGAVSGALVSGTIRGISSAIAGNGFWDGFADGAADGFMSGAIIGAITGAISSSLQIANSAKCWDRGNYRSAFESMKKHYERHVIEEGFQKGNNIVKYTKDAMRFAKRNASVLKFQPAYKANLHPNWSWLGGKLKMNGQFTSAGKILTFWYIERS